MDKKQYQINPRSINALKFPQPQFFHTLLLDTTDTCNLHCLYCHNPRSNLKIDLEDFKRFIGEQVAAVSYLQIGCGMEPLMDKRLVEFVELIHNTHAAPFSQFRIQTNGILLHKHNIDRLRAGGVNLFTISMDTLNPDIHKELRGGSNLEAILNNIKTLQTKWEGIEICFVATVTKRNLNGLEDLIRYAIDNNIKRIEIRNMFHFSDSEIIRDHNKMRELSVPNCIFLGTTYKLYEKYKNQITMLINDKTKLESIMDETEFFS